MTERQYTILIKVDRNDADYSEQVNTITQTELDTIMPLIDAIRVKTKEHQNDWFHNYEYPCYEEQFNPATLYPHITPHVHDFFLGLCPPINNEGFHTIERIEIGPAIEWTVIFKT